MNSYIVIAGNGETSRNNLEALVSDYVIMLKQKKKAPMLAFLANDKPSLAQTWAWQYAKDKGIECTLFAVKESAAGKLSHISFNQSDNPAKLAIDVFGTEETHVFLLWGADDPDTVEIASEFASAGVVCYDLTNGLLPIEPVGPKSAPESPMKPLEAEMVLKPVVLPVEAPSVTTEPSDKAQAIRQAALDFAEAIIKAINA